MLSQFFYPYKYVELLDCLLEPESIYRLVRQASVTAVNVTYSSAAAEKPRDATVIYFINNRHRSCKIPLCRYGHRIRSLQSSCISILNAFNFGLLQTESVYSARMYVVK